MGWAQWDCQPGQRRNSKKYRELIAIAVSAITQCPYCMEAHAKAAHAAGAATHGAMALKFFDKQAEQKRE
jgi:AhpD family alkylhydroperoxidase